MLKRNTSQVLIVMRVLVAITGASGVIYGLRLLEVLKDKKLETHCVISEAAKKIIRHEVRGKKYQSLIESCHAANDIEASFSSGSFKLDAMVVAPCSMKTLAAIANGYADNLITRAADVMLKERRKLVLVPRETPLSAIHLENMLKLSQLGVVILPAMPAFYHNPKSVEDLVDFVAGKTLDALGIENNLFRRWR